MAIKINIDYIFAISLMFPIINFKGKSAQIHSD